MSDSALDHAVVSLTPAIQARRLAQLLPRYAYRFSCEADLHAALGVVLREAGIAYDHEVVAGPKDRFDFLVEPGVVIEVKCAGSLADALHQVDRYAARDDVRALLLVTTCAWGGASPRDAHPKLHGKPVHLVKVRSAYL